MNPAKDVPKTATNGIASTAVEEGVGEVGVAVGAARLGDELHHQAGEEDDRDAPRDPQEAAERPVVLPLGAAIA
jgi:hypothetical protein